MGTEGGMKATPLIVKLWLTGSYDITILVRTWEEADVTCTYQSVYEIDVDVGTTLDGCARLPHNVRVISI